MLQSDHPRLCRKGHHNAHYLMHLQKEYTSKRFFQCRLQCLCNHNHYELLPWPSAAMLVTCQHYCQYWSMAAVLDVLPKAPSPLLWMVLAPNN